jgi:hypothetical protein
MSPEPNYGSYIQRWHLRHGAPRHSCIRCYEKDTDTFFFVFGDAEWTAGALSAVAGLDVDEALRTVEVMRAEHDAKHDVRHPAYIRLCAACLALSKVTVPLYTTTQIEQSGEFHGIVQTDEHTRRALGR